MSHLKCITLLNWNVFWLDVRLLVFYCSSSEKIALKVITTVSFHCIPLGIFVCVLRLYLYSYGYFHIAHCNKSLILHILSDRCGQRLALCPNHLFADIWGEQSFQTDPDLPPGWKMMTDMAGIYYWHIPTGTTQWERPAPCHPVPTGPSHASRKHSLGSLSPSPTPDHEVRTNPCMRYEVENRHGWLPLKLLLLAILFRKSNRIQPDWPSVSFILS